MLLVFFIFWFYFINHNRNMNIKNMTYEEQKQLAIKNSEDRLDEDYDFYKLFYNASWENNQKWYSYYQFHYNMEWALAGLYFDPINDRDIWPSMPQPRASEEEKIKRNDEYWSARRIKYWNFEEIFSWEYKK